MKNKNKNKKRAGIKFKDASIPNAKACRVTPRNGCESLAKYHSVTVSAEQKPMVFMARCGDGWTGRSNAFYPVKSNPALASRRGAYTLQIVPISTWLCPPGGVDLGK